MTLLDEIREMVATALAVDKDDVVFEAHPRDDPGADSLWMTIHRSRRTAGRETWRFGMVPHVPD
jgi:hypothetical protein